MIHSPARTGFMPYYSKMVKSEAKELVIGIGYLLKQGKQLPEALLLVAKACQRNSWKNSLTNAAKLLSQGNPPLEIFKDSTLRFLPTQTRYILSAPISERFKGELLFSWQNFEPDLTKFYYGLYIAFQEAAIGGMSLISMLMFVLPQFREIMLGLRLKGGFIFSVLNLTAEYGMAIPVVVFLLGAVNIWFLKVFFVRFWKFSSELDYLNLMRIVATLPAEKRLEGCRIISNKTFFPKEFKKIKTFTNGLDSGLSIDQSLKNSGMPPMYSWFLRLGLEGKEEDTSVLLSSAEFIQTRLMGKYERVGNILEVFTSLFLGFCFGFVTYLVFGAMQIVLEGSIL